MMDAAPPDAPPKGPALDGMSLVDIGQCLKSAFQDRDSRADAWEDAAHQHSCDKTAALLLDVLHDHPAERWTALWEMAGGDVMWLAGLTHCRDWALADLLCLADELGLEPGPAMPLSRALAFGRSCWDAPQTLSQLSSKEFCPSTAALAVALDNQCPALDLGAKDLEVLADPLASQIAWFLARDGFDATARPLLMKWHAREGEPVGFWASLALILRTPEFHDAHTDLLSWAGTDPGRQAAAEALSRALAEGPPGDMRRDLHRLFDGPRKDRATRAYRVAAFLPAAPPLCDPYAPTAWQARRWKALMEGPDMGARS